MCGLLLWLPPCHYAGRRPARAGSPTDLRSCYRDLKIDVSYRLDFFSVLSPPLRVSVLTRCLRLLEDSRYFEQPLRP
jgi:hypothetical protein